MIWSNLIEICFEFLVQICFGFLNIKKKKEKKGKFKSGYMLIENVMDWFIQDIVVGQKWIIDGRLFYFYYFRINFVFSILYLRDYNIIFRKVILLYLWLKCV